MRVDLRDPEPLWEQLSRILRQGIADGTWTDRLPSESQLMGEHQVSRGTVRRAIEDLEKDGLVQRVMGRGTFIL